MNYGEVLKRAWDTIWKHKILWLFGLLASCTANSGGGGGGGGGTNTNYSYSNGDFFQNNPFNFNFERTFQNAPFMDQNWLQNEAGVIALIVLGILCLVLVLSLVFIAVGSAGEIGLSRGSWLVDEGEPKLTFSLLWSSIKKPFWRVFLMHFLLGIAGFLLAILIIAGVLVIAIPTMGVGLLCLIPFFCIFGLVMFVAGILISLMKRLMVPMMVNEDVSLLDAVKQAFNLLKQNFWPLILMGVILFIIQFVVGLIIAIPIIILVFGTVITAVASSGFNNADPAILIPVVLAVICLLIPLSMFVSAVLQSYLGAAWTLTYRRITGREFADTPAAEADLVEA